MSLIQEEKNSEIIAPFESKTDPWSPDKLQKLKDNLAKKNDKEDKHDSSIITKKANKGKRHQNTSIAPQEEPEKQEKPEKVEKVEKFEMPEVSILSSLTLIDYDGSRREYD